MFKAAQLIIGKFEALPWLAHQLYSVPTIMGCRVSHVEHFDQNSMFVHLHEVFYIAYKTVIGSYMFKAVQLITGKLTALPWLVHQLYIVPTAVGLRESHVEPLDTNGQFVHLREVF